MLKLSLLWVRNILKRMIKRNQRISLFLPILNQFPSLNNLAKSAALDTNELKEWFQLNLDYYEVESVEKLADILNYGI